MIPVFLTGHCQEVILAVGMCFIGRCHCGEVVVVEKLKQE